MGWCLILAKKSCDEFCMLSCGHSEQIPHPRGTVVNTVNLVVNTVNNLCCGMYVHHLE